MESSINHPLATTKCGGCGATVVMGLRADGTKKAVDLQAPVYAVFNRRGRAEITRTDLSMVDHSAVCPAEFEARKP